MLSAKALREQRAPLANAIQALRDKLHAQNDGKPAGEWADFSAEDKQEWERVNTQYNVLSRQIEIAERTEAVAAEQRAAIGDQRVGRGDYDGRTARGGDGASEVTPEHQALALAAWCRYQLGYDLDERHEEACRVTGMRPERPSLNLRLMDTEQHRQLQGTYRSVHPSLAVERLKRDTYRAALSNQVTTSGAYTIPETLVRNLEINMLAYGGLLQVADTLTTASGEPMSWPTADDTGNKGRRIGANTAVNTTPDPTFGQVVWYAYKYTSDAILVPFELLEDSFVDLPATLGEMLGERLGRILNDECTTGTGNSMPKGIVTAATTFSAASATAIAGDDLIKLIHSVDPAYRNGAGFMLHDSILLQLRLLKTGDGAYLWQNGLQAGVPDRLLSYGITINQSMDSTIASGKKTALFGQMNRMKVRRVRGVRLYRLQERYRDSDQDGFLAFLRADGNLLAAGTAPVKVLTH